MSTELQWQDEPDVEGWYWVHGVEYPCWIERTDVDFYEDNGPWSFSGTSGDGTGADYMPLGSRRVAKIPGPPQ